MKLEELLYKILSNQHVYTNITLLVGALLTYLTLRINVLKTRQDFEFSKAEELVKGTKRTALRSEYLQIYNSKHFTNLQKYMMTRPIIDEYTRLNGNHYVHSLDEELRIKSEEKPNDFE